MKNLFFTAMTSLTKTILSIIVVAMTLLVVLSMDNQQLLIESAESKTPVNSPVYNKIQWYSLKEKDIWMMNQSHYGIDAPKKEWERLAIVVDKTTSPKTARFYQLSPGGLERLENLQSRPYKVSCYMCHSNGPRAIRPNWASATHSITLWDQLKVYYWNLRIKLYGRVVPHPIHKREDQHLKVPFRWRSNYENEILNVESCTRCHKESGLFARGTLKRQHLPTIKFMLHSGHMPPLGFSISENDKKLLEQFISGY